MSYEECPTCGAIPEPEAVEAPRVADMPKLHSPFVREVVDGAYVVTPKVAEGMEWVFTDPSVIATEKLHGTNVSVVIRGGEIVEVWNRDTRIPFFSNGRGFIIQGLLESHERGYTALPDGQHFGELIGPKLHGDPHEVGKHLWIPFSTYAREKLAYKSWGKYPKTFESLSGWFEHHLCSLFRCRIHKEKPNPAKFCEGVVFVQPSTGKMAKLRRDMFPWFKGPRHKAGDA